MHRYQVLRAVLVFVLGVGFAASASAVPTDHLYGDLFGTNYSFTSVKETVQTADDDPNPLFEAPALAGDSLIFTPSSFDAAAVNNAFDSTHSTFNATITSTSTASIDIILIEEGGDYSMFGPGSDGTFVSASMGGTLQILNSTNAGDIGQIITWGGTGSDFEAVFTPGLAPDGTSLFETNPPNGSFAWTASVAIDIASLFPGATQVELQFNNQLQAFAAAGASASIQKKAIDGPKITVIPEPGTAALLALGLSGLAIRSRRTRSR